MNNKELKEKILKVVSGIKLAGFATIKDGKPWVRYVMVISKDLDFYITCSLKSRKIDQIKKNNSVHITLGFDLANPGPYVQIPGKAEILTDKETKKSFWNDMLKTYFSGPEDPDYCVIKVKPEFIELCESHLPGGIQVYKFD